MPEVVQVQNLRKTFRLSKKQQAEERTKSKLKAAVDDLSFTADSGEIFGLLGPNGAGKTTTLRILATLIRPDSGQALIEGKDILREAEAVRHKISFLTSELKLEAFFTPNYLYDFFADLHGVAPAAGAARKKQLFERFGIDRFAEVKVKDLSSGMKQKLSIAVALVHDPSIIIFDEPTNGLDVLTARVVTDYLAGLRREGKTILLSTHNFSLVEKLCDKVGVMIGGHMAYSGDLASLCQGQSLEDRFFDLYKARAEESLGTEFESEGKRP